MRTATAPDYWFDDTVKFGLSVVTHPAEEPVSLLDVKQNSRIDGTDSDEWIAEAIIEARELAETFCKRRFVSTTLRLTLDHFPAGVLYLPSPPLQSVTSIEYLDVDGTSTTLDDAEYAVDSYTEPGRVKMLAGASWPATATEMNAVEVTYVAGYGEAPVVPRAAKAAIRRLVATWFENRESLNVGNVVNELPMDVKALLGSLRWGFLP